MRIEGYIELQEKKGGDVHVVKAKELGLESGTPEAGGTLVCLDSFNGHSVTITAGIRPFGRTWNHPIAEVESDYAELVEYVLEFDVLDEIYDLEDDPYDVFDDYLAGFFDSTHAGLCLSHS